MINQRKQVVSFTAEPELIDYLNRMADLDHTSVSQYIRNVLWAGFSLEEFRNENKDEIQRTLQNVKKAVDLEHKF